MSKDLTELIKADILRSEIVRRINANARRRINRALKCGESVPVKQLKSDLAAVYGDADESCINEAVNQAIRTVCSRRYRPSRPITDDPDPTKGGT